MCIYVHISPRRIMYEKYTYTPAQKFRGIFSFLISLFSITFIDNEITKLYVHFKTQLF